MTTKQKTIFSYFISLFMLASVIGPFLVQAENPPSDDVGSNPPGTKISFNIDNPFKENSIQGLITTLIDEILIPIGGVIAVLMIMYAGFLYVTARGNPAQITKARDALLYAVIGAAILLGAWAISQAIQTTIDKLRV